MITFSLSKYISPSAPKGINRALQEKLKFDGSFEMLVLEEEEEKEEENEGFIFYPHDPFSRDFNENLWEIGGLLKGKNVLLITMSILMCFN